MVTQNDLRGTCLGDHTEQTVIALGTVAVESYLEKERNKENRRAM